MTQHCSKINSDIYRELVRAEHGFRSAVRGFLSGYDEPLRSHVLRLTKSLCSEFAKQLDDSPPSASATIAHQLQADGARAYWRQAYLNRRDAILYRRRTVYKKHKPGGGQSQSENHV